VQPASNTGRLRGCWAEFMEYFPAEPTREVEVIPSEPVVGSISASFPDYPVKSPARQDTLSHFLISLPSEFLCMVLLSLETTIQVLIYGTQISYSADLSFGQRTARRRRLFNYTLSIKNLFRHSSSDQRQHDDISALSSLPAIEINPITSLYKLHQLI
jgi:hypothetical protein